MSTKPASHKLPVKNKTTTVELLATEAFAFMTCALCANYFDESEERTPRSLACGHHFCTACLIANTSIQVRGANVAQRVIQCPVDERVTLVGEQGVSLLGVSFAVVALVRCIKAADGPLPYPIRVQNVGGDEWQVIVMSSDTLDDLKLRISQTRSECVARLLRVLLLDEHTGSWYSVDDDMQSERELGSTLNQLDSCSSKQPTLKECGIGRDRIVRVFVQDDVFPAGDLLRSFGACGVENGRFNSPDGMCVSKCGAFLFVADSGNNRIQVLRTSDGSYVRSFACVFAPDSICLSCDGTRLFVTSNRAFIHVLCIDDGASVGALGETVALGICASTDDAHVFAIDAQDNCLKEIRIADGAIARSIGAHGAPSRGGDSPRFSEPNGLCVSPDGELLFIADTGNRCVHVVRVDDGTLARLIMHGASGSRVFAPRNVCVSPDGQWLFVTGDDVHVIRLDDDAFVYTLTTGAEPDQDSCTVNCVAVTPNGDRMFVSRHYSSPSANSHGIVVLSAPRSRSQQ